MATGSRHRDRFLGQIAGTGSTSGVRVVVGRWHTSPLGGFADVMVEDAAGHRTLLAPNDEVAAYVTSTYTFDEVRLGVVTCTVADDRWSVSAPGLSLDLTVGLRMPLGWLLRAVPAALGSSPAWARAISPVAGLVMPGVRTVGEAREGRREFYGATDLRRVSAMRGSWQGQDLGALADVDPPCRFGFSSTPRTPSITTVVTTVDVG